ncbi:hypothetical protein CW696_02600 [ANME-2 cluster archaeon]|nr:MAG: hypothetical protein CW696_02600 [ANME-2 cluster archaeon]
MKEMRNEQIFLTLHADTTAMKKSTFEIVASVGSVLIFILLDLIFKTGIGFLIALLAFILIISAAGMKLAYFEER